MRTFERKKEKKKKKLCFVFCISVFGELNQLRPRDPFLVTERFRFRNVVAKRVFFEPDELEQAPARVRVNVHKGYVGLVFVHFGDQRLEEKAGALFAGAIVLHEERNVGHRAVRVQDRETSVDNLGLSNRSGLVDALGVD